MADTILLQDDDLTAVIDQLQQALSSPLFEQILLKAAQVVGVKAEELVGEYPAPFQTLAFRNRQYTWADGTISRFKSPKQQRKVFAMIREGAIPRSRTGQLGASVYSQAEIISDGVEVKVGATAPYARFVIGAPQEQALVHKEVWPSLPVLLQDNSPLLLETFGEAIQVGFGMVLR